MPASIYSPLYQKREDEKNADPCVDFFEFSCGNWIAEHPIPDHKTSYSQFEVLTDKAQEQMRDAFESPEVFPSKSMNALKSMYRRCMDKKELNRIGSTQLLKTIRFDQADLGLGANTRDYYLNRANHGKKIEAYRQLLISRVKLIYEYASIPKNDEKIIRDVNEIIELEVKIAEIMVAEEDRRDYFKRYNLWRLSDMQKLMPMVIWKSMKNSTTDMD
ncbi:hypothetical protein TELCIR_05540 [Teladorsagia circumcincta]|uniref:Peptidase M13 N-terminal domain-containing protein n=1 Tax=Teladorsagia circumcincta TaxID=45464 RepID=A0A2G9UQI3_TELCI|nr:hypothetical protein TELCIR_05540 [Teladorsagia circumcincta]